MAGIADAMFGELVAQFDAFDPKLSADIRQSNKLGLDELAQKYHLPVAETRPVSATEPVFELGNAKDLHEQILRLRKGELSLPIQTDRGYVVLQLKDILPAHQASSEEVREKVISDLKDQKAAELAKTKADDLQNRIKKGEKFAAAAKSLGLDPKTSDEFARNGSIASVGSGKQLAPAFNLKVGEIGEPLHLGQNWMVFDLVAKTEANPADLDKQRRTITDNLLQSKRSLAFEAFRAAVEERMKAEGKLKLMPEKMRGFGDFSTPIS